MKEKEYKQLKAEIEGRYARELEAIEIVWRLANLRDADSAVNARQRRQSPCPEHPSSEKDGETPQSLCSDLLDSRSRLANQILCKCLNAVALGTLTKPIESKTDAERHRERTQSRSQESPSSAKTEKRHRLQVAENLARAGRRASRALYKHLTSTSSSRDRAAAFEARAQVDRSSRKDRRSQSTPKKLSGRKNL